jgi:hypothetical protein
MKSRMVLAILICAIPAASAAYLAYPHDGSATTSTIQEISTSTNVIESTTTITMSTTITTTTTTSNQSTSSTAGSTSSSASNSSSAVVQVYKVTFVQNGTVCRGQTGYFQPWGITVDGMTEVEPSNATLPIVSESGTNTMYPIVFSLPNGTYTFDALPVNAFYENSGSVQVAGSDVTIVVPGPVVYCPITETR